jgi:hypothetical protein
VKDEKTSLEKFGRGRDRYEDRNTWSMPNHLPPNEEEVNKKNHRRIAKGINKGRGRPILETRQTNGRGFNLGVK